MTTPQVVVAGHICLDVIPPFGRDRPMNPAEALVPGKLINVGGVRLSTGGPVSNTGIALAILGIPTNRLPATGDYWRYDPDLRIRIGRGDPLF